MNKSYCACLRLISDLSIHTPPVDLQCPLRQVLKESRQSALRRTVTDSVFYSLMRQSDAGIAHEALLNGEHLPSDSGERELS